MLITSADTREHIVTMFLGCSEHPQCKLYLEQRNASWDGSILGQKRPGTEASRERSVLRQKRPETEAPWDRSILGQKHPGTESPETEMSWDRSILGHKSPGKCPGVLRQKRHVDRNIPNKDDILLADLAI